MATRSPSSSLSRRPRTALSGDRPATWAVGRGIEWRTVMESTADPIEHAKIRCAKQHWFLLPVAALGAPRQPAPPRTHVRSGSTVWQD